MPNAPATGRKCPNCHAFVPQGRSTCGGCRLEVSKMDAFAAAKRAAQQRGIKTAEVQEAGVPIWKRIPLPSFRLIFLVVVVGGVAGAVYWFTRPGEPAWKHLPSSKEQAVSQLFQHISTGQDLDYDQAYALVPPDARNPKDDDELGHYRGLYHAVYMYLTGEFGSDWNTTLSQQPDPANPDRIVVTAGLETLHVHVSQQTPTDKLASAGPHYGITGIEEFDIRDASKFQSQQAQLGFIGGVAGQGAVDNIQTVLGALGGHPNETPIQTKYRLLPVLRDPRQISRQAVIKIWKIRKDPVVIHRLQAMTEDDRYSGEIKDTAKEVLTDKVDETELIAVGVD